MGDRNAAARERVRTYRERKREAGLRLVRYWVPDTRSPEFLAEARRQCLALNASPHAEEDQAWVDAVSGDIWDDEPWDAPL